MPPLTLLFDGRTQLLIVIELLDPGQHASFRGQTLCVDEGNATRKGLAKILGPTDAPSPHPSQSNEALVRYPGAAFGVSNAADTRDLLTRLVVTSVPKALAQPENVYATAILQGAPCMVGLLERAWIKLKSPTSVQLFLAGREPIRLVLGKSTAEDVRVDVGPPSRTFYREDDRLSIHSTLRSGVDEDERSYFASHFHLGLDFLFNAQHVLIKVIMHGNTPGEALFGRFAKALFSVEVKGQSWHSIERASALLPLLAKTSKSGSAPEAPLLLDRHADAPEGLAHGRTTEIHGFAGIAVEVTQSDAVETCWLSL